MHIFELSFGSLAWISLIVNRRPLARMKNKIFS